MATGVISDIQNELLTNYGRRYEKALSFRVYRVVTNSCTSACFVIVSLTGRVRVLD